MSRTLKVIVIFLTAIVLLVALGIAYMGFGVWFGVKGAKNNQNEAIKKVACSNANIYLTNYYEENNKYPENLIDWAPAASLNNKAYTQTYIKTGPNSFVYSVSLDNKDKFYITEKDLFQTRDSNMDKQCREWLGMN